MTVDDSIKCRFANSGVTDQVGGFQNPGVCLQAFPSFLPPPPHRSFTGATFLAVFDSRSSFFSPKPHRNACYAGYSDLRLAFLFLSKKTTIFLIKKLLCTFASAFKKILKQGGCVQAEKNLCNSSEC